VNGSCILGGIAQLGSGELSSRRSHGRVIVPAANRACLEQAELGMLEESRAALRNVAGDYQAAAFSLERRRPARRSRNLSFRKTSAKKSRDSMGLTGYPFRQQPTATH
jgi:hypothetical protein